LLLTQFSGKFDHPTFMLAQASLLMNELARLREHQPNLPIIMCGDFNSERRSLVREYVLNGMPNLSENEEGVIDICRGEGDACDAGKFSSVWKNEFNKTCDKSFERGERVWTADCFDIWKQLWFETQSATGRSLLPRNHCRIVPLADAYEDQHRDECAFTVPGEKLIIDHM
jgi:hypothetical protein